MLLLVLYLHRLIVGICIFTLLKKLVCIWSTFGDSSIISCFRLDSLIKRSICSYWGSKFVSYLSRRRSTLWILSLSYSLKLLTVLSFVFVLVRSFSFDCVWSHWASWLWGLLSDLCLTAMSVSISSKLFLNDSLNFGISHSIKVRISQSFDSSQSLIRIHR